MILSTCERFELYASGSDATDGQWLGAVASRLAMPVDVLQRHARILRGDAVAPHLLRVAAGLESRIVGEPHVLGQVKAAYQAAIEAQTLDAHLATLGRMAIAAGKRVRSETELNRAQRSIVTVAVDHLDGAMPAFRECSIAVVGSGAIAADLLSALRRRGVSRLTVVSRNVARAERLAGRWGAELVELPQLGRALRSADAVVACTSAPSYVLDVSAVASRPRNPLQLVDLAMPPNIDPAVKSCPGVCLTSLDGLTEGTASHTVGIRAAEGIVVEEHARYLTWKRDRALASTIARWTRESADLTGTRRRAHRRVLHDRIMRLKREVAA